MDLSSLINNPHRSQEFWVAYASVKGKDVNDGFISKDEVSLYRHLSTEERNEIDRMVARFNALNSDELGGIECVRFARRIFFKMCSSRRITRHLLRGKRQMRIASMWSEFKGDNSNTLRRCKPQEMLRIVGRWLGNYETYFLNEESRTVTKTLAETLPLYACSGELEFDSIRGDKATRLGSERGSFWSLGRDGGGQHELRFRIAGRVPKAAVSLVSGLGQISRNGGHIHINCKGDEAIGSRVFHALRYHLSWMQWMMPKSRRELRFCPVSDVRYTFREARELKYAAVSCVSWNVTGTVEMRVWPSSRLETDWTGRAGLMQSIAKWSEGEADRMTDDRAISIDSASTRLAAWEEYFTWAAIHDKKNLRWTLRKLKDKARSLSYTPSGSGVDIEGARHCIRLVQRFEASGVSLSRYTPLGIVANDPQSVSRPPADMSQHANEYITVGDLRWRAGDPVSMEALASELGETAVDNSYLWLITDSGNGVALDFNDEGQTFHLRGTYSAPVMMSFGNRTVAVGQPVPRRYVTSGSLSEGWEQPYQDNEGNNHRYIYSAAQDAFIAADQYVSPGINEAPTTCGGNDIDVVVDEPSHPWVDDSTPTPFAFDTIEDGCSCEMRVSGRRNREARRQQAANIAAIPMPPQGRTSVSLTPSADPFDPNIAWPTASRTRAMERVLRSMNAQAATFAEQQ